MKEMKLLLVDDEQRFLETTKALLEKRDVTTYTAPSGLEGLKQLEEHRVDVVILDVKMPGMDGVETLRKIKTRYPLIEVIMLTGHASVRSAVEGLRQGAFDYLVKPCDVNTLLDKVRAAYQRKKESEEKIRKAKVDDIISHPLAVFDKE